MKKILLITFILITTLNATSINELFNQQEKVEKQQVLEEYFNLKKNEFSLREIGIIYNIDTNQPFYFLISELDDRLMLTEVLLTPIGRYRDN